jgi:hypothetical protein
MKLSSIITNILKEENEKNILKLTDDEKSVHIKNLTSLMNKHDKDVKKYKRSKNADDRSLISFMEDAVRKTSILINELKKANPSIKKLRKMWIDLQSNSSWVEDLNVKTYNFFENLYATR